MKLRDGHVSNSSSSSFVLVTTKENYEKVYAKASSGAKSLADDQAIHKKIGSQELVFFAGGGYEGGDVFTGDDWYDFREELCEDAESTYYHREDI